MIGVVAYLTATPSTFEDDPKAILIFEDGCTLLLATDGGSDHPFILLFYFFLFF
jgi:hypothetical protein